MRRKLSIALCIIAGSFFLYCGQSAMNVMNGGDGGVGDANAQQSGCCTPTAPTFTKIAEGDLTANMPSPDISVGAYREVVVYLSACFGSGGVRQSTAKFRPDANTPYGYTGTDLTNGGGRVRVDGSDLQLVSACSPHYIVAGVQ
jgi:hypothetical protein